jgi:hypothetical protein
MSLQDDLSNIESNINTDNSEVTSDLESEYPYINFDYDSGLVDQVEVIANNDDKKSFKFEITLYRENDTNTVAFKDTVNQTINYIQNNNQ